MRHIPIYFINPNNGVDVTIFYIYNLLFAFYLFLSLHFINATVNRRAEFIITIVYFVRRAKRLKVTVTVTVPYNFVSVL